MRTGHIVGRADEEAVLQQLLEGLWGRQSEVEPVPEVPPGKTARDVYAEHLQQELGQQYGADFSDYSTSLTLDSIEYFLFPNLFIFPGLSLPMVYRFRPDPESPDFCWFDLYMLRPKVPGKPVPAPPNPQYLDVADSYTLAPGLGRLGAIYDQDTGNMAAQTRGFKNCERGSQTLGNYQEVRIRHLHQRVEDYLND